MKQGGLYDGRELILGHNSPFKNIPCLLRFCDITFKKLKYYSLKIQIDEIDGKDGHIYIVLKKY